MYAIRSYYGFNEDIERWDFAYFSEKLKAEKFEFSEEMTKPYFMLENVEKGIFELAQLLYNISFKENSVITSYSIHYTKLYDQNIPAIIIIYGDHNNSWKRSFDNKDHCDIDAAIAIDHMTLMASDLGLGTCWVCHFNVELLNQIIIVITSYSIHYTKLYELKKQLKFYNFKKIKD